MTEGPWTKFAPAAQSAPAGPWAKFAPSNSHLAPGVADAIAAAKAGTLQISPERAAEQAKIDLPLEQQLRDPGAFRSVVAGGLQGVTLGWGDEMVAKIVSSLPASMMSNGKQISYDDALKIVRSERDNARIARPITSAAAEVGGALLVPMPGGGATSLPAAMGKGALIGGTAGAISGAGNADGTIEDRIMGAGKGAAVGGFIGAAVPALFAGVNRVVNGKVPQVTIDSLREAKTKAYNAVDATGERFTASDLGQIAADAKSSLAATDYLPDVDLQTKAMLAKLEDVSGGDLTIGQLDKVRQNAWKRYNTSGETGLLDIIDAIDNAIASRAGTSDLMSAARVANSQYKKAELLDFAFTKAQRQTDATGSGGNILNKMRQAVASIMNNPNQSKWFSAEEKAAMDTFIKGNLGQNTLRLIGKLAPTGNGLMTALNLAAVAANPAAVAGSVGASAAKLAADRATKNAATGLINQVAGQPSRVPNALAYPGQINALAGLAGGRF